MADLDLAEPPPAPPVPAPPPAPPAADPALAAAGGSELRTPLQHLYAMAEKYRVDPQLALAILKRESGGRQTGPDGQVLTSSAGAQGMFQLLPRTAYDEFKLDPKDPFQNVEAGIRYLRQGIERGDGTVKSVASYYHGGPNKQLWGPVTGQYAQGVEDDLRQHLAAQPEAQPAPAAAPAPPPQKPAAFIGPRPPPAQGVPGFDEQHPWLARMAGMITNDPVSPTATPTEARVQQTGAGTAKFLREGTQSLNPVNIVQGVDALNTAVQKDPVGLARSLWDANAKLRDEGRQLMDQARASHNFGQSLEGLTRIGEGMIPILGPQLARAHDFIKKGEYASGAGTLADVGVQAIAPEFLEDTKVPTPTFKQRLTPNEAAAVKFGEPHGVVDLATATGNLHARTLQQGAEAMPGGAIPGEVARWRRQEKLPKIAEGLASGVYPTPVLPGEAGLGLRSGTQGYITGQDAIADQSYATLRAAEADPQFAQTVQTGTRKEWQPDGTLADVPVMETMPLPADVRAAKAQLKPILDEYLRDPSAVVVADASPGLAALRDIVNGSDFMRASDLQKRLSAIGKLSRGADLPALRGVSQGLAAKAYEVLQAPYQAAVKRAGPAAEAALDVGRAATTAKYGAEDTLGKLGTENVGAFQSAVRPNDAGFGHLSELARMAPQEIPKVARAVLDTIMGHGTGLSGGWAREAGTALKWEHLGPQTKQLLFGARTADLDNFFLLQKMLAKSANPSRSALAALSLSSYGGAMVAPWFTAGANTAAGVFSVLSNTRWGVRLLTKGLTIPAGTAQAAVWSAEVAAAVRRANGNVATPPPEAPGIAPPAPPWKYSRKR